MAAYTVAADEIAVHDKTLSANTVESVTFARDPAAVEILSDGAAAIYVTTDGSTPTVSGGHCHKVPAFPCERTIRHNGNRPVRLISSGTPTYSVTGV